MKKTETVMINPIIAHVNRARAAAILPLSPPDDAHWIPPRTIKIRVKTTAAVIMRVSPFERIGPSVSIPPLALIPPGGCIACPPGSVNAR